MRIPYSTKLALWANRLIALALLVLLFTLPSLLDWYADIRPLQDGAKLAIAVAFYCCAVLVALALWQMDRLLRNILGRQVFIRENTAAIRRIRWCCLGVGLICVPAAYFYPPLIFMVVIMGFLSLVVSVLAGVMDAAVAIREENDLTV